MSRDYFIWRDPATTEEALAMERAAYAKADHERQVLRAVVATMRRALIECMWAAGQKADEHTDDMILITVSEAFAQRVSDKDRENAELAAQVEELQTALERALFIGGAVTDQLTVQVERAEKLEAERNIPLTYKEFARAAENVLGWKGEWLSANLALGTELRRRGIEPGTGPRAATATALAEIDRLQGFSLGSPRFDAFMVYDGGFRDGCAQFSTRELGDVEVHAAWRESSTRTYIDDALANRKLTEQP